MQEQENKKNYGFGITMFIVGAIVGSLITAGIYGDEGTQPADDDDLLATSTLDIDADAEDDGDDVSDSNTTSESDDIPTDNEGSMADRSGSSVTGTVSGDVEYQGSESDVYIDVQDQTSGSEVIVSRVVATTPVWIAVRENSDDGMGNILGAKWVPAGEHQEVDVQLLRGTESGNLYFATLYEDNGDKEFDHMEDVLMQYNGNTVYSTFTTTN